ncbi:hypothetical protein [Nocardiopsis sp. FIRDI 009]|uniref:hypothetical protein n=1 Tax=Nocardiopsis sp. FIRDI 009 TaxID=714197 RepID=UPI000E265064|nr:hypothetical protein [Nocardiopsis sp. FIRDI 009]
MHHQPARTLDVGPTSPANTVDDGIRDMLAAVLEAIDLPNPRTADDEQDRDTLLADRVRALLPELRTYLHDVDPIDGWCAEQIRSHTAALPVTYRTR